MQTQSPGASGRPWRRFLNHWSARSLGDIVLTVLGMAGAVWICYAMEKLAH